MDKLTDEEIIELYNTVYGDNHIDVHLYWMLSAVRTLDDFKALKLRYELIIKVKRRNKIIDDLLQ